MAIRVFTVIRGKIKPGASVRKCISKSGTTVFAILVGRDKDNPGFLPVKGMQPHSQKEDGIAVEVQMVELDTMTMELTACADNAEVDDEYVLVVFSAQSRSDAYYRGDTKAESHSGLDEHVRLLNRRTYSPTYPEAQFVQLLTRGDTVTAHARYEDTLHTEFYCWDGERLLRMKRNTFSGF